MNEQNDYDLMLFYFAYQTFITTADDIIESYGLTRQHHRFLFFICKMPGITIKDLLNVLQISKQGSHRTLKDLKDKALVYEQVSETDGRIKELYPTDAGKSLIQTLNTAQRKLLKETFEQHGTQWSEVMESIALKRSGFETFKKIQSEMKE